MQKDFPGWHRHKEQLHAQHHTPTFQEREIWWCGVGVNVGHEMDGKNQFYNRPVLIVHKFNPHIFFGVPLTTKIKQNPYYLPIRFKDREQCVMARASRTKWANCPTTSLRR
jgi:mRNA interferase MazF